MTSGSLTKELMAKASLETRDFNKIIEPSGNLYKSLAVIGKRAKQISVSMRDEMHEKLARFADKEDNLEEVFENREQIEMSRNYERMPKPTTLAMEKFLNGDVKFRTPSEEDEI